MKIGRPNLILDIDDIVNKFNAGETESSLARLYGTSRGVIHRRLISANINLRTAIEASDLRRHKHFNENEIVKELIDGLLLGDASIEVNQNSEGRLSIEQREDRLDWLKQIEECFLANNILCSIKRREARNDHFINGHIVNAAPSYYLRTRKYNNFTEQRDRWYPNGKKIIPKDVLLTPYVLANWYGEMVL